MGKKIITKNKRASFDYFLHDRYEAGLVLQGTEIKSLRQGKASIGEAFITIEPTGNQGEAWINNMKIPPYKFGTYANHEEARKRKLLLHAKEIQELQKAQTAGGYTIVPTILYFKNSRAKLEIALAKGKKLHDKRESIKEKDAKRKLQRKIYE